MKTALAPGPDLARSTSVELQRTHCRYAAILLLLFAAGVINYIDRQTLSVLKPIVKTALATDDAGYAFLVNAFTFCYAAAYMATGWIVDRIGPRLGLVVFIATWSLASVACGLADTFWAFVACRAVLGLAEPGSQPVTIKTLTLWVPLERRGLMMSLVGAGGTVGSIIAAPLIAWLANTAGWRSAFVIPGLIGVGLGLAWWFVYRNPIRPAESSSQVVDVGMPWSRLWVQRSLWGIVLARFVSDPVWYYCLFWMPGYFQEQRGLTLQEAGRLGWIPFAAASVGGILLAALSDRLGQRLGNPARARKRILVALAVLGPLAAVVPYLSSLAATIAVLCVVAVICLGWLCILGPLVADTFPAANVGAVWSIAGAFGAVGAIIFNHQIGRISTALGQTNMFFLLGGLHLCAAAILLLLHRPLRAEHS